MAGVDPTLFLFLIFGFFLLNLVSPEKTSLSRRPKRNTTEQCVGYKESPLTMTEKNVLLSLHSNLRENLTKEDSENLPKAFFMRKLGWNERLAKMAQRWADRCWPRRNPNPQLGNQSLGQLLVTVDEKNVRSVEDLFQNWTAGLRHLNPEIIAKYRKPSQGSYDYEPATQLIWWNTSQIGCGRSNYKLTECTGKNCSRQVVQLVCNYYPSGNRAGDPVYIPEKDNNLICQYDDKYVHCKHLATVNNKIREEEREKRRNEIVERMRNGMLELWPAVGKGTSLRAKCYSLWLFILLFVMEFDFYTSFHLLKTNCR